MYPNIVIGGLIIPSWYAMLFAGAIVSTALAVWLRPANFPFSRKEILTATLLVVAASLFGARILYIILHWEAGCFRISDLFSYRGGFAYFGALSLSILTLWIYASSKRKRLLTLLDYGMPFMMLSQVFVRIGCLMAGCCYGKPAGKFFGMTFKAIDNVARHPTQAYETIVLTAIFLIGRFIYRRKMDITGYTFIVVLIMYGAGRFFVEFFRTDSPAVFFNITLAQVVCLLVVLFGIAVKFICVKSNKCKGSKNY